MIRIQIPHNYWIRILLHYENLLAERFMHEHVTPRTQYEMQAFLQHHVRVAQQRETHLAWYVPLQLRFSNGLAIVEPVDPTSIEIV